MTTYYKIISILLLIFITNTANAKSTFDPLEIHIRTLYPKEMNTISQALDYLLEPIGYEVSVQYLDNARDIIDLPITPMARQAKTMAIYDAIQALIGQGNVIVVDHDNKLISFMYDSGKKG
jgi:type IV pili sensor histidine kinase/response regulator